jgi:hypothetical protein
VNAEQGLWDEWLTFYANRNDVAEGYAQALRWFGPTWKEWKPLNEAILRRWSPAGLRYIKTRAWKIAGSS